MDPQDCVIFHEDNLPSLSFAAFEDMRSKEELLDFEFTFQNGSSLKGHRVVLAAAIPFFRRTCDNEEEQMTLKEINSDALESIINFAYSGKIQITSENVQAVLLTSKRLQLTGIYEVCWEHLAKQLRPDNVLASRQLAEDLGHLRFTEIADCYIKENFEDLSYSQSFSNFPFQLLKEMLFKADIRVSGEEKIFDAIIKWVRASIFERCGLFPELFGSVRLHKIKLDYLIEKVYTEELIQSSSQCRDLVEEAINRHRTKFGDSSRKLCEPDIQSFKSTDNADLHGLYSICITENEVSARLFNPEKVTWQNVSTYGKMHLNKVVAMNKMIYIFGTKEIVSFDVDCHQWNTVMSVFKSVSFSGCVSHVNKIYFFGGRGNISNRIRCFNPRLSKWEEEKKMWRFVQDPGVASLERTIYVTGGRFLDDVHNTVGQYIPRTKRWREECSPMLCKRYDHGCASLNGKIYACGGFFHEPLLSAEVYHPLTDQWNFISSMKEPRFDVSMTSNSRKLYVVERLRRSGESDAQNIQVYDEENDEWKFIVLHLSDDNIDSVYLAEVSVH